MPVAALRALRSTEQRVHFGFVGSQYCITGACFFTTVTTFGVFLTLIRMEDHYLIWTDKKINTTL